MNILSIDAWCETEQDGDEEVVHWTWNTWTKVGTTELLVLTKERAKIEFELHFGRALDWEKYSIEDDQYNYVLVDVLNNDRPLFAIEYGSTEG